MKPVDALLNSVAWAPTGMTDADSPDGIPYATHSGEIELMGKKLRCHQLSNGMRIFDVADVEAFFLGGAE